MFLDEWLIHTESIGKILKCVDIIWIAPNATSLYNESENQLEGFQILRLTLNLRNTKENVDESKKLAKQETFRYTEGISSPPDDFPYGLPPLYFSTMEEGLMKAREQKSGGILIVKDDINKGVIDPKFGQVKYYATRRNDFKVEENPVEFLNDGNVLVTDNPCVSGFEFPTVIYHKQLRQLLTIEEHDCNVVMRCKAQLIIINETESKPNRFPEVYHRFKEKIKPRVGSTFKQGWDPLDEISKFVDVPDELRDEHLDLSATMYYFEHDTENMLPEQELKMLKAIDYCCRCFKLLLPLLIDYTDPNIQLMTQFYSETGAYKTLREYVLYHEDESRRSGPYSAILVRAAEIVNFFAAVFDVFIDGNMGPKQKFRMNSIFKNEARIPTVQMQNLNRC